ELPDQELPLQELPLQELPLQELPDHELPLQELPDQELPFQRPPDQELPRPSSVAIVAETNGIPKMSCSPESVTPSLTSLTLPRKRPLVTPPVEPYVWSMYEPDARRLTMWLPCATRSGSREFLPAPVSPLEE